MSLWCHSHGFRSPIPSIYNSFLLFFLVLILFIVLVNYSKMKKTASPQFCPVLSFLEPTGCGKSPLICKFQPNKYAHWLCYFYLVLFSAFFLAFRNPVVALESQPIP